MNIFNFKTTKKNVRQFQLKLAEQLPSEFSSYKNIVKEPVLYNSIVFTKNPEGITVMYGYSDEFYKKYQSEQNKFFNLTGVYLKNKHTNTYVEIPMTFSQGNLQHIIVANPMKFHRDFDFNSIELRNLKTEYITIQNSNQEIVESILKSLTDEQLKLLELRDTFEIDFDDTTYYTILDMEDGNYIALDKKGKVYRLTHDHEESVRLIADNPTDFFKIFNGEKNELSVIMYK